MAPTQLREVRQQALLGKYAVHLVHHGHRRAAGLLDALEHEVVFLRPAQRFDDEHHEVRIVERTRCGPIHRLVETTRFASMQTGRIDERDLHRRQIHDADDAMTRRLRARRDDAQFLADERVQQRGFADVRPTDECGETAAKLALWRCRSPAALQSISCRSSLMEPCRLSAH